MTTRWRVLLIALVAVAVAYTAAAWLIGADVQRQLERRETDVLQRVPYVTLISRNYERGIYSSTEQATYALKLPQGLTQMGRAVPGGTGASAQLTIRNTVQHGPLPGLRSFALASIETVPVLPPELARRLSATFGPRPVVSIRTRLGWLGNSRTEFSSPPFQVQLPAGGTFSGRGLGGSVETARHLTSWSGHIASGGFSAQGPRGRVEFGDMSFDIRMQRAFGTLFVGQSDFKLASVEVQSAKGGPPFVLKSLSLRTTSQANGDYLDSAADLSADAVAAAAVSLSRVVYAQRLDHLEGTALASLSDALRAAQAGSSGSAAAPAAAIRDAFSRYGVELVVHEPVIEITHADFTMPEGAFHLSAKLTAPGIRREDLSGPAGLVGALPFLDASVELRVDAALLTKLIGAGPQAGQRSDQIEKLEQQGYLKRDGAAWSAQLIFRRGKLTISGMPYPPAPSAGG